MRTVPRKSYLALAAVLVVSTLASGLGVASAQSEWTGEPKEIGHRSHARFPKDRYDLAGGCYAVLTDNGKYIVATSDGYAATAADLDDAQPFYFQATDLGRYLLFDPETDFLAASEGALAEGTYAATRSLPGQIAGGVALEQSDVAADEVAHSEANRASGRGASVVAAADPNELADWKIVEEPHREFHLTLPATSQALVADGAGALELVDNPDDAQGNTGAGGSLIDFERTDGCTPFPEVEVNIDGPVMGGQTDFQEVRGFMDLHLHGMAFEFLGGRARCARPWSPYGVTKALVDCPDHHPGGEAAVLEQVLSGSVGGHDPDGWPSFVGWPRADYLTHEQLYYKWLERAWRGGLRMYTNLLVDNAALCKLYPFKSSRAVDTQCNEMDGVRLQHKRILELQRYIDAQSGGPGEGWFRIVTDPFQAREVMNEGKLAVVLGIEVSSLFDCFIKLDIPQCDKSDIDAGFDEVWDMGVRQMELVNKFDNALSGVTGDGGPTGVVVNQGNKEETGNYWKMETCPADAGDAHDKQQMSPSDIPGSQSFTGRDSLVAQILSLAGTSGAAPAYPAPPHCNVLGLSPLGDYLIRKMANRGMIFDPDHMSASARDAGMDIVEELGYSGVVSSHSWADDTIYPRVYAAGGVVTPSDSSLGGFLEDYYKSKSWADDRYLFGFGYGSDVNGFSSSAGPIGDETTVVYPFTGFGGTSVNHQVSGTMTYDVNTQGVAHYGLYTDWIQGLRQLGGDGFWNDMTLGPEAYLQMWERAVGIPGDACRSDIPDLTSDDLAGLDAGMNTQDVLAALGQPHSRLGTDYTYCFETGTGTLRFTPGGDLSEWSVTNS
ncbi:MAG: hypothetical protein QOG04_1675 [Actinomycetota bacterium]|jgi:hypothetical protein|nr:hypothetical protein [Actinomycetota bacterium]